MTPRNQDDEPAGATGDVPLDPDWPDIDSAQHRFRVDHDMLHHVGNNLMAQTEEYHGGPGGAAAVEETRSLGAAWGGWEAAAPLQASAEQAMQHAADVYQRLLKEYETAGRLLLETAQNYADADITTHLAAILDGSKPPPAGW